MSAKELKTALDEFVKKYEDELLDVGCTKLPFKSFGKVEAGKWYQYIELDCIKIKGKEYPVELWVDSCKPKEEGGIRYCFAVDFTEKMKSEDFLRYAVDRNIPVYLFNTKIESYKINDFNTLVAEYTTENENDSVCRRIAFGLENEEIKKLSAGKNNWGYLSYYFDMKKGGAICAIKNFFETILPSLDETVLDDTTRKAVFDARIGHGKYKDDMLKKWDNVCAVSGCSTKGVLIASHAKPWKKCDTAKERISPDNGLILTANFDALFDKGLITFEDNGTIKISKEVKKKDWKILGLSKDLKLRKKLNVSQKRFMSYHRKNVWLDREK